MAKLKLDLHDIYNRGQEIDAELNRIMQEALDKKLLVQADSMSKRKVRHYWGCEHTKNTSQTKL